MYGLNEVKKSKIEEMQTSFETKFNVNSILNPFYLSKEFLNKLASDNSTDGLRFFIGYEAPSIKLIVYKALSNGKEKEWNFEVIDGDFVILNTLQEDALYPETHLNETEQKNDLLDGFKGLPDTKKGEYRAFFVDKDSLSGVSDDSGLKIYLGWGKGWGIGTSMEGLQLIFSGRSMDWQSATEISCTAHFKYYDIIGALAPPFGGNTNTRPCPPYGGCL